MSRAEQLAGREASQPTGRAVESRQPPFFIVGCPRSGTTLLAQILAAHSRLAVYLEMNYYDMFGSLAGRYGTLAAADNRRRFVADVVAHVTMQQSSAPSIDEVEAQLRASTFAGVFDAVLSAHAEREGKRRGGEKTPLQFVHLARLHADFPTAPVLFLVRDPRDVVVSMGRAWSSSVGDAARVWNQAFLALRDAPEGSVHMVRYEQLVREPEKTTRAICDLLGEEFETGMLAGTRGVPDHLRTIAHLDLGKLEGPVVSTSIGTHHQLAHAQIREIEVACAAGMAWLGYEFETPAPPLCEPVITAPGRVGHVLERVRYYGRNPERWRRGWFRWRMILAVHARRAGRRGPR